jgi:hypothetical protein
VAKRLVCKFVKANRTGLLSLYIGADSDPPSSLSSVSSFTTITHLSWDVQCKDICKSSGACLTPQASWHLTVKSRTVPNCRQGLPATVLAIASILALSNQGLCQDPG